MATDDRSVPHVCRDLSVVGWSVGGSLTDIGLLGSCRNYAAANRYDKMIAGYRRKRRAGRVMPAYSLGNAVHRRKNGLTTCISIVIREIQAGTILKLASVFWRNET